jgi:hypothetical protein
LNHSAERQHVIEVARSWIMTPFHDCVAVKGAGVDCANLLAAVYAEAGVIKPVEIARYSPQWFLHRSEELFIGYVLRAGGREIDERDVEMGDIAMFKLGRCFAHGAIIINWPDRIIHAHAISRAVVYGSGWQGDLAEVPRRFFSLW